MSYLAPDPTIRFESADGESSPVEASLQPTGQVRIITDPDSGHLHTSWLWPSEVRELALELLGLADAAEAIHEGELPEPRYGSDETDLDGLP